MQDNVGGGIQLAVGGLGIILIAVGIGSELMAVHMKPLCKHTIIKLANLKEKGGRMKAR
jgi:hypothetical protein